MLFSKGGDIAVGLTLVLPVLLAGGAGGRRVKWHRMAMAAWVVAMVFAVFRSRGGLLALAVGALVMRPRPARVVRGVVCAGALLAALYVTGVSVEVETGRTVDARSAVASVVSVFGGEQEPGTNYLATREWRSEWWADIWDDVVEQRMVLHGHGWGDNLAIRHGIVPPWLADDPLVLRLPHNVFFSLAGRAGLALAVAFVTVPVLTLAQSFGSQPPGDAGVLVEVARAGVAAGMTTALADIYVESPQGGILVWSLVGLLWWLRAISAAAPTSADATRTEKPRVCVGNQLLS
jgi:hypothetical protein